MLKHKITLRPRYAETDQMGIVYYSRYAEYFEVARTECIREIGITYAELEKKYNVWLPVRKLEICYLKPAYYDEKLTIFTEIRDFPTAKITFHHTIVNEKQETLVTGSVQLVFLNPVTRRPCRPPEDFIQRFRKKWIE